MALGKNIRILFVCTGNSARSQMAEAFTRHYGQVEASSAGIDPKGLHPLTVEVMAEKGIDVSDHQSTALTDEMFHEVDYVVTVCGHADEHCPVLPAHVRKLHWPIKDPALLGDQTRQEALALFRQARDDLEVRVRDFLDVLPERVGRP